MRLSQIKACYLGGARILVPDDTVEAGRNIIEHNYPDSNSRWLEDNGSLVENFRITGVVPDDEINALLAVIRRPGPHTLRHPWYGRSRVAVMGSASVARSDRHLGYFEVDIPVGKSSSGGLTLAVPAIAAVVTSKAESAVSSVFASMSSRWSQ